MVQTIRIAIITVYKIIAKMEFHDILVLLLSYMSIDHS